jgi:hypothetical protein
VVYLLGMVACGAYACVETIRDRIRRFG